MTFINNLVPCKRELHRFLKDYISIQRNVSEFVRSDFRNQLGYYIDYLSNKGLIIIVNKSSYRIYFETSNVVKRKTVRDVTIMELYQLAIIDAFNYIELPF